MNETTLFRNDKFGEIRNIMEGANPWFVANDVAKALGYKATNDLTKRLDPDEVDTTNRRMTLVNLLKHWRRSQSLGIMESNLNTGVQVEPFQGRKLRLGSVIG